MAFSARFSLRKLPSHLNSISHSCPNKTQTVSYYLKPQPKKQTSWSTWIFRGLTGGVIVGAVGILAAGHNWDGLDDEFDTQPFYEEYPGRAKSKIAEGLAYMMEPRAQELLLPDLLPPPYQAPYTLLIEMNDLMVSSNYTRNAGWRRKKRQGIDIFLESLCKYYEIVIFTNEPGMNAYEVIEAIDPKMCVLYKLFRDSTRYKNGVYLKDLTNLNRDLSKVIVVDTIREAVTLQPENALILPKWVGEDDMDLVDLADMLVVIAQDSPKDIRDVIKCYTDLDDPITAFRMRRKEIFDNENRMKLEALQKQNQGVLSKKWW